MTASAIRLITSAHFPLMLVSGAGVAARNYIGKGKGKGVKSKRRVGQIGSSFGSEMDSLGEFR
jgi:hypothetical protein